jgi:hypothetical protein
MQPSSVVEATSPVVLIIGNTVLMDGIEACLQELQMDNLVHWNAISAEHEKDLKACHPKLVIFDRDAPSASILLNLLKETPGTHLLGVDCKCHHVLIMNSFQIQTKSMSDLQRIVQDIAGGRE